MDSKPVRRYNRLAYELQPLQYVAKWLLMVSGALLIVASYVISALGLLLSGIGIVIGSWRLLLGESVGSGALALSVIGLLVNRIIHKTSKEAMRCLQEPILPPSENPILPDAELLVRASAPNAETQRAELLRASTDATDTPPEQLLRATSSKEA